MPIPNVLTNVADEWRLRDLVQFLEKENQLVRVQRCVSPLLEISEIQHRVSKARGPALLFENIEGSSLPLLTNLFGTRERIELVLGHRVDATFCDTFSKLVSANSKTMDGMSPVTLDNIRPDKWIPLQGVDALPIMQGWPGDGGRYVTFPLVFTRNPDTGAMNCGIYRMQVIDANTTCIHWQSHSDGYKNCQLHRLLKRPMEVVIAIGCAPQLLLAAAMGLPYGINEMALAGVLQGNPVLMERCQTLSMTFPAATEIVLEGTVDPGELRQEGPFGDYTGYYSNDDQASVFRINLVRHQHEAIYLSTLVGKPSLEFVELIKFIHTIKLAKKKMNDPDIVDYYCPPEGAFTNFAFISIRKRYPGHARAMIEKIWSDTERPSRVKIVAVFDADVNIRDLNEAFWHLGGNIEPTRDVFFGEGPLDDLNHSSSVKGYGSKLGIDATTKWPEEGYMRQWPQKIRMSQDIKRLVQTRWESYFAPPVPSSLNPVGGNYG